MPEQLLYSAQIGAPLQEVGGKRVAEGVRKGARPRPDQPAQAPGTHLDTPSPYPESGSGTLPCKRRSPGPQVALDGIPGVDTERNDPVVPSLTRDQEPVLPADRVHCERRQLGHPHPGGIEGLQHRPVAQ